MNVTLGTTVTPALSSLFVNARGQGDYIFHDTDLAAAGMTSITVQDLFRTGRDDTPVKMPFESQIGKGQMGAWQALGDFVEQQTRTMVKNSGVNTFRGDDNTTMSDPLTTKAAILWVPHASSPSSGSTKTQPRFFSKDTFSCVAGCCHMLTFMLGAKMMGAFVANKIVDRKSSQIP